MDSERVGFDQIIAPLNRERFLSEFWNRSFLHLSGQKGRFTPLLPWEELNAILRWHCPPQPQLRLFQDGKQVEVRRYIDGDVGAFRLNAGGLIASLSQGATMILDQVQEVAPRVSQLTETIQEIVHGLTHVNLYAGWCTQAGFDLHWDAQDLIVLQLSGRKHWKVYGPTRLHPLADDIETPPKPSGQPIWDGILEDGAMLHIPRGWWHVAYPLGEPSLHLTFSVEPPNGADFLRWWMRKMLRHPEVRKNLPPQSDTSLRRDYLVGLRQLVEDDWNHDRVGEFLNERKASWRPPPFVQFPFAPIDQKTPLSMATRIRVATSHSLFMEFEAGDSMAKLRAGRRSWSFRPELIPVFERLSQQKSVSLRDLCVGIHDQELITGLMQALEMLANAGVILKEAPGAGLEQS